jgi:hypothetical protein
MKKSSSFERERERQQEAKVRQDLAAKRTPEERLAILNKGGFRAERERAKLQKLIDNPVEVKKPKVKK